MRRPERSTAAKPRWVVRRKLALLRAIEDGLITPEDAGQRYGLSAEELAAWRRALALHGAGGLSATFGRAPRRRPKAATDQPSTDDAAPAVTQLTADPVDVPARTGQSGDSQPPGSRS